MKSCKELLRQECLHPMYIHHPNEVCHIETPSERTTLEGFRSAVFQRTPSVQSHPTSSPISFFVGAFDPSSVCKCST